MTKIKRINLIVKGEGIIESLLGIREKKVKRAVDSALDFAQEQILEQEAAKLKAIEELGKGADSSENCKNAINKYCDACEAIIAWEEKIKALEQLKSDLNEEVEVE